MDPPPDVAEFLELGIMYRPNCDPSTESVAPDAAEIEPPSCPAELAKNEVPVTMSSAFSTYIAPPFCAALLFAKTQLETMASEYTASAPPDCPVAPFCSVTPLSVKFLTPLTVKAGAPT